jgi:hypothetical protein
LIAEVRTSKPLNLRPYPSGVGMPRTGKARLRTTPVFREKDLQIGMFSAA